jgi:hypothetical protein
VAVTRQVVEFAHSIGVTVEGELGCLGSLETMQGDKEDGHGAEGVMTRDMLLTDPEQAADFVRQTQCDALAIAIGTSHGAYKFSRKPTGDILAIDRIKAINARIPNTHLVMHGSSSVPQDLLAVIREYDNSKESVINLLVTPDQFARAVVIEKQYKDLSRTHLRGMMNAIIFRDDADPVEFLTAIGDLEGGAEALADYFTEKWSRIEAFAWTGVFDAVEDDGRMLSETALLASAYVKPKLDADEVADQDWMQMAWTLRYQCPDLFVEMLLVLRAKARAHDLGLSEEEESTEDDGKVETSATDRGKITQAALDPDEESAI